jgi:RNA polymerase sigma-70 factor (ECF subfamily)
MLVSAAKDSFAEWLGRLRARDDTAARELFERFACRLIALARGRLAGALRHKVDPEDIVQSAYKSFFRSHGEGKVELESWNSLWGLLTLITLRKCADRAAYHRAECRDLAREASAAPGAESETPWAEAPGREPTPSEAVALCETVDQLLAALDEDERPILELSLQGYTTQEISARLGRAERTVRRLREQIRNRLQRMQDESS